MILKKNYNFKQTRAKLENLKEGNNMARGVNKVILIGNLGADPEVRYMPSGNAVANVTVATSSNWRDKQTGDLQERTEWHRVSFFGRLAEIVGEYLHKGSKIYVEGRLQTRRWQDKNGLDRYTTEVIASEMHILDSRSSNQASSYQGGQSGSAKIPSAPYKAIHSSAADSSPSSRVDSDDMPTESNFDDDVPF